MIPSKQDGSFIDKQFNVLQVMRQPIKFTILISRRVLPCAAAYLKATATATDPYELVTVACSKIRGLLCNAHIQVEEYPSTSS